MLLNTWHVQAELGSSDSNPVLRGIHLSRSVLRFGDGNSHGVVFLLFFFVTAIFWKVLKTAGPSETGFKHGTQEVRSIKASRFEMAKSCTHPIHIQFD